MQKRRSIRLCVNMGRAGQGGNGDLVPHGRIHGLRSLLDKATKLKNESEAEKKNKKKNQEMELDQAEQVWLNVRSGRQRILMKAERADDIFKSVGID